MPDTSNTSFNDSEKLDKDKKSNSHNNGIGVKDIMDDVKKHLSHAPGTNFKKIIAFPIHVFPLDVQGIIKATNVCLNFPVDFIGASMLYAVALSIGNTYRVKVKEGWDESVVLFITCIGEPGTNKTAPLAFAMKPIAQRQSTKFNEYKQRKKEYERIQKLSDAEREKQGLTLTEKPFWEKYTVSDFTPEALNEVHQFNKRGIGVCLDEFAGWFKNFNRYHKGAEQEFWLSIWSNSQIVIDRKSNEPIFIPVPFIPVAGNMQPGILSELAKDNRGQNGFIDRILFAFRDDLDKPYWSDDELDVSTIKRWDEIISNLLSLELKFDENYNPKPDVLNFSPEALSRLKEWVTLNTDLSNNAESSELKSIYSKLEIYAIRLALLLEILGRACERTSENLLSDVGVKSVDGAVELVEYFRANAIKVNSIISNYDPLDSLTLKYREFYEALPDSFTTSEALNVSNALSLPPDTVHKWLRRQNRKLFKKIKTGLYEKMI